MTAQYDPRLVAELITVIDEYRATDEAKVLCFSGEAKRFVARLPEMLNQLRAASEMITEYRADLNACKAVSVALQRHISQLEQALTGLVGQVEQAREGFGIYHDSPSMDSVMAEARAALAGEDAT